MTTMASQMIWTDSLRVLRLLHFVAKDSSWLCAQTNWMVGAMLFSPVNGDIKAKRETNAFHEIIRTHEYVSASFITRNYNDNRLDISVE